MEEKTYQSLREKNPKKGDLIVMVNLSSTGDEHDALWTLFEGFHGEDQFLADYINCKYVRSPGQPYFSGIEIENSDLEIYSDFAERIYVGPSEVLEAMESDPIVNKHFRGTRVK